LKEKDFKVFEDGKPQAITTFAFEADATANGKPQTHYLVLFFDNSTMSLPMQTIARKAAAQFLENNSGAGRMTAVVNFNGSLQVAQNFTDDTERLKQVVSGVGFSTISPAGNRNSYSLDRTAMAFGARNMLVALASLAKNLKDVPGRKSLILLSAGFRMNTELYSDLSATISVCNRANVAVYPIDVRGLFSPVSWNFAPGSLTLEQAALDNAHALVAARRALLQDSATLRPVLFSAAPPPSTGPGPSAPRTPSPTPPSRGTPSPSPSRPGTPSPSPSRPGTPVGGGNAYNPNANPQNQPRSILPRFPTIASDNQQVLYALANGTGGFVIVNTNDLLGGLEKIGRELNQHYVLGYVPPPSEEGTCHTITVKVDRAGAEVRSRSGYCNVKPRDLLAGSASEKELEAKAFESAPGAYAAPVCAPYFYTARNTALVNVALEIPGEAFKFAKSKGMFDANLVVLGVAVNADGKVAARFSDKVPMMLKDKAMVEAFHQQPFHYENQFNVAAGDYKLKIVFTSGDAKFGKVEAPLRVEPYDPAAFSLSGVALSNVFGPLQEAGAELDTATLEERKVLIARGLRIVPSGSNQFSRSEPTLAYLEVYAPSILTSQSPSLALQVRIVEAGSGEMKLDSGLIGLSKLIQPGNPMVPIGVNLPIAGLTPGTYRAEFSAADAAGKRTPVRTADFAVR
jgi:hypothetical protein